MLGTWLLWMAAVIGGAARPDAAGAADPPAPVVVELFTSQGCSSCPPADALWRRLGESPRWRERVVPLAFHVDYWDRLGWKDPFSSAAWSARQAAYARAFGSGRVYTPQAVVAGRAECVGSDEGDVAARVEAAERAARVRIGLRRVSPSALGVAVAAPDGGRALDVVLAIYERGRTTAVGSGENGGRTLHDAFIVRRLATAFSIAPGAASPEREVPLHLDPAWQGVALGAAVFVQDPVSRQIFGGRALDL